MKQLLIPFKENADIPESHLHAFIVCNSAGKYWRHQRAFYKLKNEMLEKYGHACDYDLQVIKKECYTCGGSGMYSETARCHNCDNGIYAIRKYVLKRYLLNGAIFHRPLGSLSSANVTGQPMTVFVRSAEDEYDGYPHYLQNYNTITIDGPIVNTINGIIKHEPYALNPVWAYYYLLWHYDRQLFYKRINEDAKAYQTNTQHKLKNLLGRFNPLKAYAEFFAIKKKDLELIDDLPF